MHNALIKQIKAGKTMIFNLKKIKVGDTGK